MIKEYEKLINKIIEQSDLRKIIFDKTPTHYFYKANNVMLTVREDFNIFPQYDNSKSYSMCIIESDILICSKRSCDFDDKNLLEKLFNSAKLNNNFNIKKLDSEKSEKGLAILRKVLEL